MRTFELAPWMTEYPEGAHLVTARYSDVRPFKSRATREGVGMGQTKKTDWYKHHLGADVGFCAVIHTGRLHRLKGDWIAPEWRGLKIYRVLILHRLLRLVADHPGDVVEILTRRPDHLGRWGFETTAELRHGVTRMKLRLPRSVPEGSPWFR